MPKNNRMIPQTMLTDSSSMLIFVFIGAAHGG